MLETNRPRRPSPSKWSCLLVENREQSLPTEVKRFPFPVSPRTPPLAWNLCLVSSTMVCLFHDHNQCQSGGNNGMMVVWGRRLT